MDGVAVAGLELNGDGGQAVVIVDQVIDLASEQMNTRETHFNRFSAAEFAHFNRNPPTKMHISISILLKNAHKSIAREKLRQKMKTKKQPVRVDELFFVG